MACPLWVQRKSNGVKYWESSYTTVGARCSRSSVIEFLVPLAKLGVGLHFNPQAYEILFHEMVQTIAQHWPDQVMEKMPFVYPGWEVAPW